MGLEAGNLRKLIHPELHIDEFKSKLGDDAEICVISFKVNGKEPAQDLVNFIEKGYSWVVDADVSSGEMDDGDYIVFLEIDRNRELPENVMAMMEDIMQLTNQDLSEWRVRYHSNTTDHDLTLEDLSEMVPLSPEEYDAKYGTDDDQQDIESDAPDQEPEAMDPELQESLNKLRAVAGVQVTHKAPKNDFTEALRIAAGIR